MSARYFLKERSRRCGQAVLVVLLLLVAVPAFDGATALRAANALQPEDPPLSAADTLAVTHVRDGYAIELVAAESLVNDPVAIAWGPDGRLWVAEMADYPLGMDGQGSPGGRIRFLEDTSRDGKYDSSTVFLDEVRFPTGVMPWRDGVLVTAAPEIIYMVDTDGDRRADKREVLFSGFQEGNQQLRVNGLRWGLDNWVYCASGAHHGGYGAGRQLRAVKANETVTLGSRDFRFRPNTGEIDPQSGPSQYGRSRDDWGNWFGQQNSHPLWHFVLQDHYLRRNPHVASPDPRRQLVGSSNPKVYPAKSRSLTDQKPGSLLTSILDPSAAVDGKFVTYIVLTDDGRTFTGMIASETGNSITLVEQEKKQHVILRTQVAEIRSTGKSLMPDGLEKDMTHQDFADLISYIRTKDSKSE